MPSLASACSHVCRRSVQQVSCAEACFLMRCLFMHLQDGFFDLGLLAGRRRQDWWRHRLEQMWCQATSCHAGRRVGICVQSYIWRLQAESKSLVRFGDTGEEWKKETCPNTHKTSFIPYSCSLEGRPCCIVTWGSLTPFRQLLPDGKFLGDLADMAVTGVIGSPPLIPEEFLQQLRNTKTD